MFSRSSQSVSDIRHAIPALASPAVPFSDPSTWIGSAPTRLGSRVSAVCLVAYVRLSPDVDLRVRNTEKATDPNDLW